MIKSDNKSSERSLFEGAVKIILDVEEGSPEFYLALSVIQCYKMYVLEKKIVQEKKEEELKRCENEFISSRCC